MSDIEHKHCYKCNSDKSATLEFFKPSKRCRSGLLSLCRQCSSEKDKAYRIRKKSKVDELIKSFSEKAKKDGYQDGVAAERRKWTRYLPADRESHITWLEKPPTDRLKTVVVITVNEYERYALYRPDQFYMNSSYMHIDFEPVPMALNLASGQQIRWFHWKPRGPYPVSELAVMHD